MTENRHRRAVCELTKSVTQFEKKKKESMRRSVYVCDGTSRGRWFDGVDRANNTFIMFSFCFNLYSKMALVFSAFFQVLGSLSHSQLKCSVPFNRLSNSNYGLLYRPVHLHLSRPPPVPNTHISPHPSPLYALSAMSTPCLHQFPFHPRLYTPHLPIFDHLTSPSSPHHSSPHLTL